ncbi:MAG: hypothetical protein ABIH41_04715 [Nanoarchaeota archaeon]
MRWVVVIGVLLVGLCAPLFASAAVIEGHVYDYALDLVDGAVVTINTTPHQRMVAANASFAFSVAPGSYLVEVSLLVDGVLESSASDELIVADDGRYVRDIILFPDVDIPDDPAFDELDFGPSAPKSGRSWVLVVVLALIVVGGLVVFMLLRRQGTSARQPVAPDDHDEVLAFIRAERRVTQKQVRQRFPLSEAKISLLITDYESKGLVRKVKKGRGNIIIYQGEKR